MKCKEFRIRFDELLLPRRPLDLTTEMREHADGCAACSDYRRGVEEIDYLLRHIPPTPVPEDLGRIGEIILATEKAHGSPLLRGNALRKSMLIVFATYLAWLTGLILPPLGQFAFQLIFVFLGTFLFSLSAFAEKETL